MPSIDQQLAAIDEQICELKSKRDEAQRRRPVTCQYCKKRTQLGKLVYIQTHWYEEPYGCTGGACWRSGEGQFKCPKCGEINRLIKIFIGPLAEKLNAAKRFFSSVEDTHEG